MKGKAINLSLPWPPSVNHYWRMGKGHMHVSGEGKRYRRTVGLLCSRLNLTSRLAVDIKAYPPDNRRRDLDNVLKALLDAMQHGGIYIDDCQIDDLRIMRRGVVRGGQAEVKISCMT